MNQHRNMKKPLVMRVFVKQTQKITFLIKLLCPWMTNNFATQFSSMKKHNTVKTMYFIIEVYK